jgi:hypothetical protein
MTPVLFTCLNFPKKMLCNDSLKHCAGFLPCDFTKEDKLELTNVGQLEYFAQCLSPLSTFGGQNNESTLRSASRLRQHLGAKITI